MRTWKISDFTAIKRKPRKENLFFFKGDVEKTAKGYILIPWLFLKLRIGRQKVMHEVKLQNLKDRWAN